MLNSTGPVHVIDLSQIVWLRKRLGRAQLATKLAGINVAPVVAWPFAYAAHTLGLTGSSSILAVGAALASVLVAFWLARGLRRGTFWAVWFLTAAFLPYATLCSLVVARCLRKPIQDAGTVVSLALWVGTTYFVLRGLLAVRAVHRTEPDRAATALMRLAPIWESGAKVVRPAAFANKHALGMYVFLLLSPLITASILIVFVERHLLWLHLLYSQSSRPYRRAGRGL